MRSGKHQPARLTHYLGAHQADLVQLAREGFILEEQGTGFEPTPGGFLLSTEFLCEGGIRLRAQKLARIVEDDPNDPVVETAWYSYHVSLQGVGNIFRYDSPFLPDLQGHHRHHHVHRYDLLQDDREGTVEIIEDEDEVPHLGDVVREARDWFYRHLDELRERGLV